MKLNLTDRTMKNTKILNNSKKIYGPRATYLTIGPTNDAGDMFPAIFGAGRGAVAALKGRRLDGVDGGTDEFEALIERVRITGTGVEYDGAQLDVAQQIGVGVDFVNREQHRLQPLDAPVLVDRPTMGAV